MTSLRPNTQTTIGRRMADQLTPRNVVVVVLGLAMWHYTDLGAVKDVHAEVRDLSGDIRTIRQQNTDQETRLNILRESGQRKVDKDTYDRDMRNVFDSLNRIQVSIDGVHSTLEARPR